RGLRFAQEQEPSGFKCVVKRRQYLPLQVLFEIDEQIAARDQVHLREGGITQKILPGEDDHLAEELGDAIIAILLDEEPAQPLRRKVMHDALGIKTGAPLIEHRLVDVRGKKLKLARLASLLGEFQERHGNGISFLAGGATQYPDAYGFVARPLDELG